MPAPYPARQIGVLFQRDDRDLRDRYGEMAAPFFRIEISDQSDRILFSAEAHANDGSYDLNGLIVSDVEWEENDCQASMMSMTIQNIDMTLHDSRLFAEGNSIDLWMGYDGLQPDYMGRAIIVEPAPTFPSAAIPTIQIAAYDISHYMMEEGRAEIQAEGTKWWERNRINNPPANNTTNQLFTTNRRDRRGQAEADRRAAREAGALPGDVESIPEESVDESGGRYDLEDEEIEAFAVDRTTTNEAEQPTTPFRQARIPRRRRDRGKVWRNMKDSEIAAAIFQSYGIVPFVEATNENARARHQTSTTQNVQIITDNVQDRNDQMLAAREEQRARGGPIVTPNLSVDRDGARLRPPLQDRAVRATGIVTTNTATTEVGGRRVVQKSGTSDWEFLKQMAKNHGFIVFVFFYYETRDWIGYWGSPHNVPQSVHYDFHYNRGDDTSISSFRPKVNMRGQKTEIDLVYVDPIMRREQRLRVAMENLSRFAPEFRGPDATSEIHEPLGSGPEVVLSIQGQRVSVQANRRFTTIDDARQWLMAFWFQHASEFCEGEGEMLIGIPEVHCRHKHNLRGYGRFDGEYFFTKVTHKMSSGQAYATTFSGFRMVDMLMSPPDQETDALTVESNELGQLIPSAQEVVRRSV